MDEKQLLAIYYNTTSDIVDKCISKTSRILKLTGEDIIRSLTENTKEMLSLLPNEILIKILKKLPVEDFLCFCHSSRRYLDLCNDSFIWSFFLKRDFGISGVPDPKNVYESLVYPLKYPKIALGDSFLAKIKRNKVYIGEIGARHALLTEYTFRDLPVTVSAGLDAMYTITSEGHVYAWIQKDAMYTITSEGQVYAWIKKVADPFYDSSMTSTEYLGIEVNKKKRIYFARGRPGGKIIDKKNDRGIKIAKISAGYRYAVALSTKGKIYVWGYNSHWVLGTKTPIYREYPKEFKIPDLAKDEKIVDVVAGSDYLSGGPVGAISNKGNLYMWGKQAMWLLGKTLKEHKVVKIDIPGQVIRASFDYKRACVVTRDGKLYMWGLLGQTRTSKVPQYIMGNVRMAVCNKDAVIVLKTDKTLVGWGNNKNGTLGPHGVTDTLDDLEPHNLKFPLPVEYITCQKNRVAVITSNNKVYFWGEDSPEFKQLLF